MKIESGTWRLVLVFDKFVIKFPRIYIRKAFFNLWQSAFDDFLVWQFKCKYYHDGSAKQLLFRGIIDNWTEFRNYRKKRLKICAPTYYSFFGLFNIQLRGQAINMNKSDSWDQFYKMTNGEAIVNVHDFYEIKNFGTIDGEIRMLDYGSRKILPVLEKYGDSIIKNFDFNYKHKRSI